MSRSRVAIVLLSLTALAGCRGREDAEEQTVPETTPAPTPPPAPAPQTAVAPDTTESGLWAYLQSQNYRNWSKWPGKGELYAGAEPHGMLLTTYVNDLARNALRNGASTMPRGAIIVKENYTQDSTLAAVTAMQKVAGYDASHNDWFWAKWNPNGVTEVSGRVGMCAGCHGANADADYLMTARPER
jgi:hypothetical protein